MNKRHQAIIMAGGKGTRLHPYTAVFPKPLMPLGDVPVLELLLRQLSSFGIVDVVIAVNHLRHLIQAFFGNGASLGMSISCTPPRIGLWNLCRLPRFWRK